MKHQQFNIASVKGIHRLFPVPVIEGKKFLIELPSLWEAETLQELLGKGWICLDLQRPSTFWQEHELHSDGRTRRFSPVWSNVVLNYFPRSKVEDHDLKKIVSLEKVISRHFANLVLTTLETGSMDISLFQDLANKVQAQKNCRTCKALGVGTVDFDSLLVILGK